MMAAGDSVLSGPSLERWRRVRFNVLTGLITYASGDLLASLIRQEVSLGRTLGLMALGGTLYAWEIPGWFRLVDRWNAGRPPGFLTGLRRTAFAMAYFNPLWIARHLLFINLFAGQTADIGWGLVVIGARSFAVNIPISLVGNYFIQNRLPIRWRYFGSAAFSSLLAAYYALSETWFG